MLNTTFSLFTSATVHIELQNQNKPLVVWMAQSDFDVCLKIFIHHDIWMWNGKYLSLWYPEDGSWIVQQVDSYYVSSCLPIFFLNFLWTTTSNTKTRHENSNKQRQTLKPIPKCDKLNTFGPLSGIIFVL